MNLFEAAHELTELLTPCKHEKLEGHLELNTYCAKCNLDEFQIMEQKEIMYTQIFSVLKRVTELGLITTELPTKAPNSIYEVNDGNG